MKTILIVDDEYLIAEILGYALEDDGFLVEKANNGEKALDLLRQKPIDLVVTDYMMPKKNGQELAQAIREDPALAHLPLILMSGAQAAQADSNLFGAVFQKPFHANELVAKVRELLGG
ncbi:response regulator [Pseudomonas plecoglossicida]|uniref:response regulator n=1 Tax=Pseudomonas plecoglossicida TaxID=70775 RepID=UPI0015E3C596|nr:response regulator [Pseudomonas plecoglossicida]MBA1321346.1 response regulator [Pseudomonas plecoglossicida]